ncbi:ATP synthase mitochondrial F1 complex assembly factor 2-like [Branchiostoma floridae x Branchiostoma belcheri]
MATGVFSVHAGRFLGRIFSPMQTIERQMAAARKRFYKNVSISQSNGMYEINLDRRKLKTPMSRLFSVPSEPIAIAVATEWEAQHKEIKMSQMHMTQLCNTAIDNPSKKTPQQIVDDILSFLDTDTICYREESPVELAELEEREWEPLLDWVRQRYDIQLQSSTSIHGPTIPKATKSTLKKHLLHYNHWSLVGVTNLVETLKSVVLSLALMDKHLTVEKAVALARLETEFQIVRWGNVEWAHDMELTDLRARAAASVLFIHYNSERVSTKEKAPSWST